MSRKGKSAAGRGGREDTNAELLACVVETHARFSELMQQRLGNADREVIERYLGILAALVTKLEDDNKSLRQVARETIAESAAQILAELA